MALINGSNTMTHFEIATTINSLKMIRDNHDKSVRLSRDSELETIENSLMAFNILLNYLPIYDKNSILKLLEPVEDANNE